MVTRQQIWDLFNYLAHRFENENDEWLHFALGIISSCDFILPLIEKNEPLCPEDGTIIVPDEYLLEIFAGTFAFDNVNTPVWERRHIDPEIFEKFPFVYEFTFNHLVYPAVEILEARGINFLYRDFCVEFMALYQHLMSHEEKNWPNFRKIYDLAIREMQSTTSRYDIIKQKRN